MTSIDALARGPKWRGVVAWTLGSSLMLTSLEAASLSPNDFAFGAPVIVTKPSTAYRVVLPLAVYQRTVREDLGDLRIFNSAGESAPYSLDLPMPAPMTSPVALPLFPLPSGSRPVIDGIRLSINTPAAAMNWQAQRTRQADALAQYILDGRGLTVAVDALNLKWADSEADYSGQMRVDVSEDLGAWRTVTTAPVANLRANGHALVQNRIVFAPVKTHFWRLSCLGNAPGLTLTAVTAESSETPMSRMHDVLEVRAVRDASHPNEYRFDLGAHVPVDRVGVSLLEANTVVDVAVDARSWADAPWRPIVRGAFSHLVAVDGDHQTAPLPIVVDRARYWRVRVLSGDAAEYASMRLHVEWVPDEVTFLGRGRGPYVLAYGSAVVEGRTTDLALLPTRLAIEAATVGESTQLGGTVRLNAVATPLARRRMALWGVLFMAVAALGWMAYRLMKEGARVPEGGS